MSEPKLDKKIESEMVTATLVVAEPDPAVDDVASPSVEDPETMAPKSSRKKLKDVDKKTFLFAGYVFWGMIFVSGGATAAVLLSRKKSQSPNQIESPSPAPLSVCPDEKPESGSLCLVDPELTCEYGYMNTSCDEGGLVCSPTEFFYCTSTGTDQNEWTLAMAAFVCEGDNYPSTFLDPCTPIEPSAAPSPAPTFTAAPTYGICSHDDILPKLTSVFDGAVCYSGEYAKNPEFAGMEFAYYCTLRNFEESGSYTAYLEYLYLEIEGGFFVPYSCIVSLGSNSGTIGPWTVVDFEFTKGDDPCNFYLADELLERIRAMKEQPPKGPCSHTVITDKLQSVFGAENCSRGSYVMDCQLENNQGTNAVAEYSFALNADFQGEPKTIGITYSEVGTTPTVVDLVFSDESCPFEADTSTVFEAISATFGYLKCPKEEPDIGSICSDPDLTCDYGYVDMSCDQFKTDCSPMKMFSCYGSRWNLAQPEPPPCQTVTNPRYMSPCIP